MTRAVEVAECPLPNFIGRLEGATERVAHALKLVPPDSPQAGRLLSHYCRLIGIEKNDYPGAKEAFEQALLIAQREGDITLEMRALAVFANVAQFQPQIGEGLEYSLKAIDLAQRANDLYAEVQARSVAGQCYYRLGESEQSHLHFSAALAVAERLHDRFWLGRCQVVRYFRRFDQLLESPQRLPHLLLTAFGWLADFQVLSAGPGRSPLD